jgi:hypothetical protein
MAARLIGIWAYLRNGNCHDANATGIDISGRARRSGIAAQCFTK